MYSNIAPAVNADTNQARGARSSPCPVIKDTGGAINSIKYARLHKKYLADSICIFLPLRTNQPFSKRFHVFLNSFYERFKIFF
jgi:hypothetical protein